MGAPKGAFNMTTDLVPSVSIENLVNQRAAVVERISAAIDLIGEAAQIASAAHLGMPRIVLNTSYGRSGERDLCASRLMPSRDGSTHEMRGADRGDVDKLVRLGVDATAWQYLMHESGLRTIMDAKARETWDKAIHDGEIPELNAANVRSTFKMLHDSRGEIFERGVIACFKALSWQYKTNLPQKFGKRIVITYLRGQVSGRGYGGTSLGHPNYDNCSKLDDLTRVFSVLDGKPEPDHRQGWYGRVSKCDKTDSPAPEDDYISIRSFRNGNGHITFKRPDLVDKMNKIVAKHYPGALPCPK
jgi:hypothetical protein